MTFRLPTNVLGFIKNKPKTEPTVPGESDPAIVLPFLMQVRRYQTIQLTESPLAKLRLLKQQLFQLTFTS